MVKTSISWILVATGRTGQLGSGLGQLRKNRHVGRAHPCFWWRRGRVELPVHDHRVPEHRVVEFAPNAHHALAEALRYLADTADALRRLAEILEAKYMSASTYSPPGSPWGIPSLRLPRGSSQKHVPAARPIGHRLTSLSSMTQPSTPATPGAHW